MPKISLTVHMSNIWPLPINRSINDRFNKIILQRYDIFISLVKKLLLKSFLQFLWAGENPLKNHNNLMHYFDVILLNDVN